MLDYYLADHRELRRVSPRLNWISTAAYKDAKKLARSNLPHPNRSRLGQKRSFGLNAQFYGFELRLATKRYWHDITGRQLIDLIVLHKWQQQLQGFPPEAPEFSAMCALGAMIQHKLALLLCDLEQKHWMHVRGAHNSPGINGDEWCRAFAGASAAAYCIRSLTAREHARVLLPSIHEDAGLGVDLIWLEQDINICLSIKVKVGIESAQAWWVQTYPDPHLRGPDHWDRRRIFDGAQEVAKDVSQCLRSDLKFQAALVHVPKAHCEDVDLFTDFTRLTWPDSLLAPMVRRNLDLTGS